MGPRVGRVAASLRSVTSLALVVVGAGLIPIVLSSSVLPSVVVVAGPILILAAAGIVPIVAMGPWSASVVVVAAVVPVALRGPGVVVEPVTLSVGIPRGWLAVASECVDEGVLFGYRLP